MDDKEKEFVREYNASIKHGDPIDKVNMPKGISVKTRVRRTQMVEHNIKIEPEQNKNHKGRERKKKGRP